MKALLRFTDKGIYCEKGSFFIDPWKPVDYAVITHAHSDHARWGSKKYLAHTDSREVLKLRLGHDLNLMTLDYGKQINLNGVKVSFHPAGHIFGSAQIRVEYKGEVWCVSGDYKIESDGFTTDFEPVTCDTFVTESTFGLPVFNWKPQQLVFDEINAWWRQNQQEGKVSILCAYALGKAQRIIKNIDHQLGEVFVHGAVANVNEALVKNGARLPQTIRVVPDLPSKRYKGGLVITPASGLGTSWVRKFQPFETAVVSGWMQVRGMKRRSAIGRGFVLSDHADWAGLNDAVKATGAENVFVTHGYQSVFARYLSELGYNAEEVVTEYDGDDAE